MECNQDEKKKTNFKNKVRILIVYYVFRKIIKNFILEEMNKHMFNSMENFYIKCLKEKINFVKHMIN